MTATQRGPGMNRTDLQQHELSAPGCEVVQNRVDSARRRRPSGINIQARRSSSSSKALLRVKAGGFDTVPTDEKGDIRTRSAHLETGGEPPRPSTTDDTEAVASSTSSCGSSSGSSPSSGRSRERLGRPSRRSPARSRGARSTRGLRTRSLATGSASTDDEGQRSRLAWRTHRRCLGVVDVNLPVVSFDLELSNERVATAGRSTRPPSAGEIPGYTAARPGV